MIINALKKSIVRYLNTADCNPSRITKLIKIFLKNLILKTKYFQSKLETFAQLKKTFSIGVSVFGYENKENHPFYVSKKCVEEWEKNEKKDRDTIFEYFNTFIMIILYIVKEKTFAAIVFKC